MIMNEKVASNLLLEIICLLYNRVFNFIPQIDYFKDVKVPQKNALTK